MYMSKTISKIANVTLVFWILKILATTLGETFGDFLSMTLNLGYLIGLAITFGGLILVLAAQIASKKYNPYLFWLGIIATTTAGTEISDFMDRSLHLGYIAGSIVLALCLLCALIIWARIEGNIDVVKIHSNRAEILFWSAVLISNSLGTAFGDYLIDDMGLSYIQGALITMLIIVIVVALHYFTKLNQTFLFWIAFIFTRPFGATFGDFLTKPLIKGGLDLPREIASFVTFAIFIILLFVSNNKANKSSLPL